MAYMCIKYDKECDACGECKKEPIKPELTCCNCGAKIEEYCGYYDIDGDIYCDDCMENIFRKWNE